MEQARAFGSYDGIELTLEDLGGPPPFERTEAAARLAETAMAIGAELGHPFGESGAGGVSDGSFIDGLPCRFARPLYPDIVR